MKRYLLATVLAIALLGCANHGDKYGNNQTPVPAIESRHGK